MRLNDLVKATKADLPITVRHEQWLIANPNPVYSEEALQFNDAHLRGEVGGHRDRKLAFRASGMGACARKRIFARMGTVGISEQYSSAQANIFETGNDYHRRWQRAGLTEGWLIEAEVPLYSEELDLGGTMDGRIYDGSLFEFKSINSNGFKWVSQQGRPRPDHLSQVAAYKLLDPTLTAASVVYENKDNGEWREYRVHFDAEIMEPMLTEMVNLKLAMVNHKLPVVLDDCSHRKGATYRQCPFRDVCLTTKRWPT